MGANGRQWPPMGANEEKLGLTIGACRPGPPGSARRFFDQGIFLSTVKIKFQTLKFYFFIIIQFVLSFLKSFPICLLCGNFMMNHKNIDEKADFETILVKHPEKHPHL